MKPSTEELKSQLQSKAEAVIDELVEQMGKPEVTLSDIERMVRTAGQQVMREFTSQLVEEVAEKVGPVECGECGQPMRNKGLKGRHVITETGEIWVERRYYYCNACGQGFFPPG